MLSPNRGYCFHEFIDRQWNESDCILSCIILRIQKQKYISGVNIECVCKSPN